MEFRADITGSILSLTWHQCCRGLPLRPSRPARVRSPGSTPQALKTKKPLGQAIVRHSRHARLQCSDKLLGGTPEVWCLSRARSFLITLRFFRSPCLIQRRPRRARRGPFLPLAVAQLVPRVTQDSEEMLPLPMHQSGSLLPIVLSSFLLDILHHLPRPFFPPGIFFIFFFLRGIIAALGVSDSWTGSFLPYQGTPGRLSIGISPMGDFGSSPKGTLDILPHRS